MHRAVQGCKDQGLHSNMQPFMKLFLTVLLAHLLKRFPASIVEHVRGKRQGIRAYVGHGAIPTGSRSQDFRSRRNDLQNISLSVPSLV